MKTIKSPNGRENRRKKYFRFFPFPCRHFDEIRIEKFIKNIQQYE